MSDHSTTAPLELCDVDKNGQVVINWENVETSAKDETRVGGLARVLIAVRDGTWRSQKSKPFSEMTDTELLAEYKHWEHKVISAPGWGASLVQAAKWRDACASILSERGIAL